MPYFGVILVEHTFCEEFFQKEVEVMKMLRYLKLVILFVGLFIVSNMTVHASDFDAVYYANKYSDVREALGTDPNVLYNHYLTFGIKEGRFKNLEEEQTGIRDTTTNIPDFAQGLTKCIGVNKTIQTVTYYENGVAIMDSPCVTGDVAGNHDTPSGTYTVKEKVNGKYLKGSTWNCWVDKWIRFTDSAIGLHDASWRKDFGGNIYLTDGSHGCVNLPKDFVYALYDKIEVGTPVVVY